MSVEADGIDNDCDGKIDEEQRDRKDNDRDGRIDEDLGRVMMSFIWFLEVCHVLLYLQELTYSPFINKTPLSF